MKRFENIYPFTTENIAGYMNGMNLTGKDIITITGSSDHIFNAISNGARSVTAFDINPLTKYYMELKRAGIIGLNFEMFIMVFLELTKYSLDYETIKRLPIEPEAKKFWLDRLKEFDNDGVELKRSELFHVNYFHPLDELWTNLYLEKKKYNRLRTQLKNTPIEFISSSIEELKLDKHYDYMFLSNVADYIESLEEYHKLIDYFLEYVDTIYMAYLYDLGTNKDKPLHDLEHVREVFGKVHIDTFRSVLGPNKRDGVLILKKIDKKDDNC